MSYLSAHTHLGQVITYAAGLDAVTIIWIAARFTEEHRAALDWLNEVSHEQIRFFGLAVELWKIADSPVAPKFNVVAKPNDWSKTVREVAASGKASEAQRNAYRFWSAFCNYLDETDTSLSSNRTPSRDHWMTWGIGRTGFHLTGIAGFRDGWVGADLVLDGADGPAHFHLLHEKRASFEKQLGEHVTWEFEPERKQNYVRLRLTGVDPKDEDQWPRLHAWIREKLERLDRVFRKPIAGLEATAWEPPQGN